MHSLGGDCKLAVELDDACRLVYERSFRKDDADFVLLKNIREITRSVIDDETSLRSSEEIGVLVPDHDVLCGGFPCQPFSKSGEQAGFRDRTRGTLFLDILQIIEAKRPGYVFLENVRNLAGPRHTETWRTVVESLAAQGYRVLKTPLVFSPHFLPPDLGGAPQVRERVFICGVREDLEAKHLLDIAEFNEALREKRFWNPEHWSISDYLLADSKIERLEQYKISSDEETYLEAWNYLVENIASETLPGFPIWAFAFTEVPELRDSMPTWERTFLEKNAQFYSEHKSFLDDFLKMKWGAKSMTVNDFPRSRQILEWQARRRHPSRKGRTLRDLVIQFRPSGIRVKPPTYLPALVAITQTSVVGPSLRRNATKYRKLTPVEASRLQGIPDYVYASSPVSDKDAYKQLGNAVNVGIIKAVASILLRIDHGHLMTLTDEQLQLNV